MCMRHTVTPRSAHSPASSGSSRRAVTSLTMSAPAPMAASATSVFVVSMLSRASMPSRPASTGITRRSCSSAGTAWAPGRVDSPPMSRMPAPSATSCRACAIALSGSSQRPPSENESGVTLTTPMTTGSWTGVIMPRTSPAGHPGHVLTAVDDELGAVDPARAWREEERGGVGDLLDRAEALVRELLGLEVRERVRVVVAAAVPRAALEEDRAGAQRVHADAVGPELAAERDGEMDLRGLRCGVLRLGLW